MNDEIAIRPSRKTALNSREQYIVTFGDFVCLRILGDGSDYEVMTATADEDNKRFLAPANQALLIELAQKTAEALGGASLMCRDNYGRNYVKICRIENDEDARRVVEVFSGLLHEQVQAGERVESEDRRELREIYEAIAPDDSGEDAYLGDGVWMSSDGRLKDLGR
jgi:hypothetical protein